MRLQAASSSRRRQTHHKGQEMERQEYTFTLRTDVLDALEDEAMSETREPSQQLEHILKERYAHLIRSHREYVIEHPEDE